MAMKPESVGIGLPGAVEHGAGGRSAERDGDRVHLLQELRNGADRGIVKPAAPVRL